MFIAIIHNMNTWGRYCIRLSHQIALQYTSQLSAENYTLVTVQHIRETNSTYYGNGSTKPFRIYGLHIWSTFNAYTYSDPSVACNISYYDRIRIVKAFHSDIVWFGLRVMAPWIKRCPISNRDKHICIHSCFVIFFTLIFAALLL